MIKPASTLAVPFGQGRSEHRSGTRIEGGFVRGPIPLKWISEAAQLPGKSLHAALACWYLMNLRQKETFKFSNVVGQRFGLDKDSKARALKLLESAGLIACNQRAGRSVEITMLNTR